jgi:hypothetical protein
MRCSRCSEPICRAHEYGWATGGISPDGGWVGPYRSGQCQECADESSAASAQAARDREADAFEAREHLEALLQSSTDRYEQAAIAILLHGRRTIDLNNERAQFAVDTLALRPIMTELFPTWAERVNDPFPGTPWDAPDLAQWFVQRAALRAVPTDCTRPRITLERSRFGKTRKVETPVPAWRFREGSNRTEYGRRRWDAFVLTDGLYSPGPADGPPFEDPKGNGLNETALLDMAVRLGVVPAFA